jgi:hypothetical protein
MPIRNTEMFLATVYKSPQRLWSDTDITELLGFRSKYILAGDLHAKHPLCKSNISKPSALKLLELFDSSNFEISAPQLSKNYTPDTRGNVLEFVVHHTVRQSEVTVTDILDSDHLPVKFRIFNPVRTREA